MALFSLIASIAMLVGATGVAAVDLPEPAQSTLVVDDDRVECPTADYATIEEAVDAAPAGTIVRVCPGRYPESVSVRKPLTLLGRQDVVEAIDCFALTLQPLSPLEVPIVGPSDEPGERTSTAFTLRADDIELSGFVVMGVRYGVSTDDGYSGYRIHHSLFAGNELGIHFASGAGEGATSSRVDHNCLRGNDWGLSNSSFDNVVGALVDARVDHNSSYLTRQRAYEGLRVRDVTYDNNDSRQEPNTIILSGTRDTRFLDNRIERVGLAMTIGSGSPNEDLLISGNQFLHVGATSTAIGFNTTPTGPNRDVTVSANTITGYATGIAIGGPPFINAHSLEHSVIADNTITNSTGPLSSAGNAIRLRPLNNNILFRGNILDDNQRRGIYAECSPAGITPRLCPLDNTFRDNEMLRNGVTDAHDESGVPGPLLNTWIGNKCVIQIPQGLCLGP